MIKKCYCLMTDKGLPGMSVEQINWLYGFEDEDYTNKKDYIKNAKAYTEDFNKEFNTTYNYQDLFGEPVAWRRYCTECGISFPAEEEHDCEDW